MGHILAVFMLVALQQTPAPPAQGAQAQRPPQPCAVSDDPTYALTPENPAQLGGGALYVAAREQRYLNALRGPDGQTIRYKRIGSMMQSKTNMTILDRYEVTWDGLDKPIAMFLDVYHYWEPRAPKGFFCGQPIQLQPIVDSFQATDSLTAAAIEQGATKEIAPIPLDVEGTTTHGYVWDGFRTLAAASRAAAAKGKTLGPEAQREGGTVIVAYPLACEGKSVLPVGIDLVPPQGQMVPRTGDLAKGDAIAKLLPGTAAPAGSLAARFPLLQIRPNDRVRITYAEAACPQGTTEVILPFKFVGARPGSFSEPPLPEGANPAEKRILLQVLIDLDGKLQQATYVGGPIHLQQAAIDAVKTWRAETATINGAPVPTITLLEVRFK